MGNFVFEYQGTFGIPTSPEGLDPNHRGGYRGERMIAGPDEAAYGDYRERHRADLGPASGTLMRPGSKPPAPLPDW